MLIGALLSCIMPDWSSSLHCAFLVLICFCVSTGTRKDEWALSFEGDTFLRRANFHWVDEQGMDLPNTIEVLATRKNGCLLRGRSAPAKCDRLNVEWGAKDQWFRFDDTNPLNFAWRWWQWETRFPCPTHERETWPAFSPNGDHRPFKARQADALLAALLVFVLGAAEAAVLSWHAFRVTIAMALLAERGKGILRDEIEGVIQTVVRWKTVEALRIYARMKPKQYADYVDMATRNDASLGDGDLVPEIEPYDVCIEHEATLTALAILDKQDKKPSASSSLQRNDLQAPKRRKTGEEPAEGNTSDNLPPLKTFDLGDGVSATAHAYDSWALVGLTVEIDNAFWGWACPAGVRRRQTSSCFVAGYIGTFTFPNGKISKHTYVINCDGFDYPIRHSEVLKGVSDARVKRKLKKSAPPRPVSRHPHQV
jgi:hypothetical protein